jgi:tetratricopeptide (TPR) repeat protein
MSQTANYYAMLNERQQADEYIQQALAMASHDSRITYRAASTYEQIGEREKALYWIEHTLRAGFSHSEILAQPSLEKLVNDERFQKMIRDIPE